MLKLQKSNQKAIEDFNKLPEKSRIEIKKKWSERVGVSERTFINRLSHADFSVDERVIFDEICEDYFVLMPQLFTKTSEKETAL